MNLHRQDAREQHRVYLQSDGWRALRAEALERDGYRCRLCHSKTRIEVHHRRYPWRGEADHVRNLTCLCDFCHGIYHSDIQVNILFSMTYLLLGLALGALLMAL